jgi:hypothetical protein
VVLLGKYEKLIETRKIFIKKLTKYQILKTDARAAHLDMKAMEKHVQYRQLPLHQTYH